LAKAAVENQERDAMSEQAAPAEPLSEFTERLLKFNKVLLTRAAIAQTPKETVWALNKARLYRYAPAVPREKRHPIPLLLVFAIMNRPSILDLRPGHSFVEFMLARGFDVYLLDWGAPGYEDRDLKFDDYALEYLPRAIRRLKSIAGTEEFSLLGWCIGAIITTIYSALLPDEGLRNLLLLTAPLDFSNRSGLTFARWTDERYFDVDKVLGRFGNMPGEMIDYGARALKPVENYVSSFCKLWDNLDDARAVEAWHAMNTWVTDTIPMAGAAYRQLIVELYRKNKLIKNELVIGNRKVNLANIRANLLTVIAAADHITPPCQSESILEKAGSRDKEAYHIHGGHIGIMAGSSAQRTTWPHIAAWLNARSD
jgi:polyhydroxyalkanoate synthase subunit PhaC